MGGFAKTPEWIRWRSRMELLYYSGALLSGLLLNGYFSTEYKYVLRVLQKESKPNFTNPSISGSRMQLPLYQLLLPASTMNSQ